MRWDRAERVRSFSAILLLATALLSPAARAEVTRESPIVEETAHTLHRGEWKLGITTSSYGITDRLQLDSALLLEVLVMNAGLKYKFVDAPNLALSGTAFGGGSVLSAVLGVALLYGGVRLDASVPLAERLALNLAGSWQIWYVNTLGDAAQRTINLRSGRISWFHVKGALEYVYLPRHIFFFTLATPTSWLLALDRGGSQFDALDFAQATFGYQYSAGIFNIRFDIGLGPSLLGFGPTASLDLYFRF